MSVEFHTWLQSLGGLRADMPMTVRGLPVAHVVTYQGDMTGATLLGVVKASPDSTSELVSFQIGQPTVSNNVTSWNVSLSGVATGSLPADGDGDGLSTFVFDFILAPSGSTSFSRLFGGLFPVSGYVTEPV